MRLYVAQSYYLYGIDWFGTEATRLSFLVLSPHPKDDTCFACSCDVKSCTTLRTLPLSSHQAHHRGLNSIDTNNYTWRDTIRDNVISQKIENYNMLGYVVY